MPCPSSPRVLGLVWQVRGWVTLKTPCPPPLWEAGGMRRSRVEREDLPTPQQDREGKESKQAETCTWVCAKCLGNSSTKMPLG